MSSAFHTEFARRVILAVDQATTSGWSIHLGGRPLASGVVDVWSFTARRNVIREAYALSADNPFLFVYEDHSVAPLRSYKWTGQVLGLGGSLWLWLDSLNRIGHPSSMRVGVTSREWRRRVLGVSERVGRDECKAQAVRWAEAYTGKRAMTDDEAEAIALGAFHSLSPLPANDNGRPRSAKPRTRRVPTARRRKCKA